MQLDDSTDTRTSDFDVSKFARHLHSKLYLIIGLAAVCAAIGMGLFWVVRLFVPQTTHVRLRFAFAGLERGEYPDESKFNPEDVFSPDVIARALRNKRFDSNSELFSKTRAGLNIEPVVPGEIVRMRDRARAAGQVPPVFVPDEYELSLSLARRDVIAIAQQKEILSEIVSVYRERFENTYIKAPEGISPLYEKLKKAEYIEYEFLFAQNLRNIERLLNDVLREAPSYRSPKTGVTFNDLILELREFSELKINGLMGRILAEGLVKDPRVVSIKLQYHAQVLESRERRAREESDVVEALLNKAQTKVQDYVLGIRSQASSKTEGVTVDQGLINSLAHHDSYNLLVRESLDAGRRLAEMRADRADLEERKKIFDEMRRSGTLRALQSDASLSAELLDVAADYERLTNRVKETYEDYGRNRLSQAVQLTSGIYGEDVLRSMIGFSLTAGLAGALGGFGIALLSMKGVLAPESRTG